MNIETNSEHYYWIGLNAIPSMTAKKFKILLENFSNPQEIWESPRHDLEKIPAFRRYAQAFDEQRALVNIELEIKRIVKTNLRVVAITEEDYPRLLRSIEDPPAVIYYKGTLTPKDELAIAIVGTRKPSPYGRIITEKLSSELGKMGFTIVSGMALGIDTAAHRGTLKANARTMAVMGGGFGKIYPSENRSLVNQIAESGAVLTEHSVETKPDRWTFPKRNRIISGLTRGTIVVEAPERSGALITARAAAEHNREVFVVPGPINDDSHLGSHRLIQKGAKLITCVDDILAEFADLKQTLSNSQDSRRAQEAVDLSPLEAGIYKLLEFDPLHFNDVVERSGKNTSDVSLALLQLAMKSLIKELEGKRYAKLP